MADDGRHYKEGEEFPLATLEEAQTAVRGVRAMTSDDIATAKSALEKRVRVGEGTYLVSLIPEALTRGEKRDLVLDVNPLDEPTSLVKILTTVRRGRSFLGILRLVVNPEGLLNLSRLDHEGEEVPGEFTLGHDPRRIAATRLSIKTERMP